MDRTKEQRDETNVVSDATQETTIDKKLSDIEDKGERMADEYNKAYYAAFYASCYENAKLQEATTRQAEQQDVFGLSVLDDLSGTTETSSHLQLGMKSRRGDNVNNHDDEWEDAQPAGNAGTSYKLAEDLNMEAKESEEEEGDSINREEG
ncbi:hypothetical protein LUZ61_017567 [Rhynchospora tenuis]|uniref:Uncharacterized protein n=1 Tax=Rhynchospora tenuis TaxID=198213 RepID=A0AAD5Z7N0_9POAL|nr:hypothetical protein LUZ61_017567 [Rhynchospora tenuis]